MSPGGRRGERDDEPRERPFGAARAGGRRELLGSGVAAPSSGGGGRVVGVSCCFFLLLVRSVGKGGEYTIGVARGSGFVEKA